MKKVIQTDGAPAAIGPYSQAIASNGFLFISGQLPIDPKTGKMVEGSIAEKTQAILTNLENILKEAGGDLNSIVKTTVFLTDMNDFPIFNKAYEAYFTTGSKPARSTVQVAALPLGSPLEIEAIAVI